MSTAGRKVPVHRLVMAVAFATFALAGALFYGRRFFPDQMAALGVRPEVPALAVELRLVTRAADGTPANGPSREPTLSAHGESLVFTSRADNLDPNDQNDKADLFFFDAGSGSLERLQVAVGESEANDWLQKPVLAADGHGFTFASVATNLVAHDTNGIRDVFWHDLRTGQTTLVSVSAAGSPAVAESGSGGGPAWASMESAPSADGRYVLFTSTATNLAPVLPCRFTVWDLNACTHAFLHDRVSGETVRLSTPRFCPQSTMPCDPATNAAFADATGSVSEVAISADGRYAAFASSWEGLTQDEAVRNCLPADHLNNSYSPCTALFVFDRTDESLTLISRLPNGKPVEDDVTDFTMSADGRLFVMEVGFSRLFMRDRVSDTTRVLPLPAGYEGSNPVLSGDGSTVIFTGMFRSHKEEIFRYHLPSGRLHRLDQPHHPVNFDAYALNLDGTVLVAGLFDGADVQGSGGGENLYLITLPPP